MVITGKKTGIKVLMVLAIVSTLFLTSLACASGQDVIDILPSELPDKGNPKLDSQLNQLLHAEKNGEAESFAEQHGIDLVDGKVRVIIECENGQLDSAVKAATEAGANVETSYENLLQIVVPISSLDNLTDAASIRFIRLPQYPLPAVSE